MTIMNNHAFQLMQKMIMNR